MSLTRIQPSGLDQTLNYSANQFSANTVVAGGVDLYVFANSAFTTANAAGSSAMVVASYGQANTATGLATSAYGQANTGTSLATGAFVQANTATGVATSAYGQANTAVTLGTNAYNQANTGTTMSTSAYVQANTAVTLGTNAYNQANTATTLGTAAFNAANNKLDLTSGGTIAGATSFEGTVTFQETTDVLQTGTVSTTTNYDMSLGNVFYHAAVGAAANWTANFTNVSTTDNRTVVATIIVTQGATGYIPNAVQIDGSAQTINWVGGSAPTAGASKKDVFAFSLIRTGAAWLVLGQAASYG